MQRHGINVQAAGILGALKEESAQLSSQKMVY